MTRSGRQRDPAKPLGLRPHFTRRRRRSWRGPADRVAIATDPHGLQVTCPRGSLAGEAACVTGPGWKALKISSAEYRAFFAWRRGRRAAAAEAGRPGHRRAQLRVVGRHDRMIRRQSPLQPVALRRQPVRVHQVPPERGHFPSALETDHAIGEDRLPASHRRRRRSGLTGHTSFIRGETRQRLADVLNQPWNHGRAHLVRRYPGRHDFRGQSEDPIRSRHERHVRTDPSCPSMAIPPARFANARAFRSLERLEAARSHAHSRK
jgi:hypothetical protein